MIPRAARSFVSLRKANGPERMRLRSRRPVEIHAGRIRRQQSGLICRGCHIVVFAWLMHLQLLFVFVPPCVLDDIDHVWDRAGDQAVKKTQAEETHG